MVLCSWRCRLFSFRFFLPWSTSPLFISEVEELNRADLASSYLLSNVEPQVTKALWF